VSSEEAQAAINRAESKVILAYKSALEAEKDGVDISSLLVKLNDSSLLLSEAQMQYRLGNFSEATYFANQCYDSLYGIETEAEGLRDYAAVARKQGMLISVIGSSLGICAIYFGSLIGWRFFNTRYHKRVLEMKPEVQANDSK
jgi:predicted S18 family serine protease